MNTYLEWLAAYGRIKQLQMEALYSGRLAVLAEELAKLRILAQANMIGWASRD